MRPVKWINRVCVRTYMCVFSSSVGQMRFRSVCLSRLADSVLNGAKRTEFENKDVKDGHLHVAGGNADVTLFLI